MSAEITQNSIFDVLCISFSVIEMLFTEKKGI